MTGWTLSELISAVIGILGGLLFSVGPKIWRKSSPPWVIRALFLSGLFAIAWAIAIIIRIYWGPSLTAKTINLIKNYRPFLGGASLGVLLTLFISGELSSQKWRRNR